MTQQISGSQQNPSLMNLLRKKPTSFKNSSLAVWGGVGEMARFLCVIKLQRGL